MFLNNSCHLVLFQKVVSREDLVNPDKKVISKI